MFYSGGISGAITDLDSLYATEKAYELYDEIHKRSTDIEKIYYNIGGELTLKELRIIKSYLFIDEHDLPDGRHCRFNPAFDIAQSWMRIANGSVCVSRFSFAFA